MCRVVLLCLLLLLLSLLLCLESSGLLELELPVGGHHSCVVHVQAGRMHVHGCGMSMVAAWPAGVRLLLLLVMCDCGLLRDHLALLI